MNGREIMAINYSRNANIKSIYIRCASKKPEEDDSIPYYIYKKKSISIQNRQ